jgi:CDP-diacylglycerol--serine O-phosphatidyltransferase
MTDEQREPDQPYDRHLDETDREILAEGDLEARRIRGIKFLPNAITTTSMFFGFYSIMMSISGKLEHAVWAILISGICDMLDGRVARMTKSTSAFGMEFDSLSDLIAFGFAPAMVAYFWAFQGAIPARFGWAAAFVYLACTAIRLAKFNTLTGEEESRKYFRGIPSPMAAGLVISPIMLHLDGGSGGLPLENIMLQGVILIGLVGISLLMVSNIRFRTLKDINFKRFGPVLPLVGLAAFIAVLMARPEQTIFAGAYIYLTVGLIEGGIIVRRRERDLRKSQREIKRQQRTQRKLAKAKAKQARREAQPNAGSRFRSFK